MRCGTRLLPEATAESPERVSILSFGSARPLTVVLARIYLSAGSSSPGYLEWDGCSCLARDGSLCAPAPRLGDGSVVGSFWTSSRTHADGSYQTIPAGNIASQDC